MWNLEEIDMYKYLCVIAGGGVEGGFKSLEERMKDARGVWYVEICCKNIRKQVCCGERRMEVAGGE